jgi:hypothetical protein
MLTTTAVFEIVINIADLFVALYISIASRVVYGVVVVVVFLVVIVAAADGIIVVSRALFERK